MPEMLPFCGRRFRVWRRIEKTCVEGDRVRRMRNVVLLQGLRCDGSAHGGCEKECTLLWHEAWLERCGLNRSGDEQASPAPTAAIYEYPLKREGDRYICQSTELLAATSPLSKADVRQYWRDLRYRTWSFRQLCRLVGAAVAMRFKVVFCGLSSVRLRGQERQTPSEALDLQPGEWVEVKARREIAATLDRHGRNRGLEFSMYMLPFCGKRYQVKKRVNRIVLETTGELREIKNTVSLENVTCDGYGRWGGCPRDAYHFWREIWLKRIEVGRDSKALSVARSSHNHLVCTRRAGRFASQGEQSGVGSRPQLLVELKANDLPEWDAFVERHPMGSIYHLSCWKTVIEESFPHMRARVLVMRRGQDGEIVGGLPLYRVQSWLLGNRIVSVPFATWADPLVPETEDMGAVLQSALMVAGSRGISQFEFRPWRTSERMSLLNLELRSDHLHHVIRLNRPLAELTRSCSRTCVRQWVTKAERHDIHTRAVQTEQDFAAFCDLLRINRRAHSLPLVPERFYRALWQHIPSRYADWMLALHCDRPLGALLVLRCGSVCSLEYAGQTDEGRQAGANQLLYWQALARAHEQGYEWFSFGRTSKNNTALRDYKRRWGSTELESADYILRRAGRGQAGRYVRKYCQGLGRRVARHIPAAMERWFGDLCYRHWG